MFYFSYLFSVLFLAFLVLFFMLVFIRGVIYIKYLVVLVYIRGVVVFILYISCICWFVREGFNKMFIVLGVFIMRLFDLGIFSKFSDVGEFMWMYFFFRFLFNVLVRSYSLNLFQISGSLRF